MIYTAQDNPDVKVFVDGIQRFDCFYADTELGVVRGYKQEGNDDNTDSKGRVQLDESGKELIQVEYRGTVTVI